MKLLLVSINSKYIHSSLAPYYLAASAGEDTLVIEGTVNEKPDRLLDNILNYAPEYVGFCSYIWNITRVLQLAESVKKKLPNTKIILGGPEVSYNAQDILQKHIFVDFIISGEGEKPIRELIQGNITNGVCYRQNGSIITSEPFVDNDTPPSPYTEQYFKNLNGRIAYIETCRGCPFNCAFCLSGRCGGVRYFDLDTCFQNILRLANSGTKTVKFIDRTFNANKERAYKIWSFIINRYGKEIPDSVCFHFEIAGDILDDSLIELLNSAPKGSIQLEIGLQSFNEKTLAAVTRKTNTKKLSQNIKRLVCKGNIHIHIDLIAGLPYEDIRSFENSFNQAYALGANMLQFGFLKLLHGAPLEQNNYGAIFKNTPPYEVICTPWLTQSELENLRFGENSLDKLYNSGRFLRTVYNLTQNNPFKFYIDIGKKLYGLKTDNDICRVLLESGADRNDLLFDILSKNPRIPTCLKRYDKRVAEIKKMYPDRAVMIDYKNNCAYIFEYKNPDKITGRYIPETIKL